MTIRMEEMTWPDIRAALDAGYTTAVIGVGATEQHGPHLPTITDTAIADALALRVARRLGGALQAKTVALGCSNHHLAFAGTLSLRPETLAAVLRDMISSLGRGGFRTIVLLPWHGGDFPVVAGILKTAATDFPGLRVVGCSDLLAVVRTCHEAAAQFAVGAEAAGAHAGEHETSLMLALAGAWVRPERFAPGYMGPQGEEQIRLIVEQGMPALTPNGVIGDPAAAAAAHGVFYLEQMADFMAGEIRLQLQP